MLQNLLLKTLRDQRIPVLAYGLGLGALALLIIAIYPSFAASGAELEEAMKNLPDAYKAFTGGVLSLTEFDGYLVSQYLIILPLILAIFAIIEGTGALRGEEERGTMDTLLSLPVTRSQVVLQKAAATLLSIILVLVIIGAVLWVSASLVEEATLALDRLAIVMFNTFGMGALFYCFSLFLSASLPSRRLAGVIGAVFTVGAYFFDAMTEIVEGLYDYRILGPFNYFEPLALLRDNPSLVNTGVLLAASLVFLAVATLLFRRRDIAGI
jgi:ABC-2 type transport system permease protein